MLDENSYDNTSQIENQKKFYLSIDSKDIKKDKTLKNNSELISLEEEISKMTIIDKNTIQSKIVKKNIKNFIESEKTIFLDKPFEINKLIINNTKRETINFENKKKYLSKKEIEEEINKKNSFCFHFKKSWGYFGKIMLNFLISIFKVIFYVLYHIFMIVLKIIEFIFQILVFIFYMFYFCITSFCKSKNYNPLKKNAIKLRSLPFLSKIKNNKYIICFEPNNLLFIKSEKKPNHKNFIKLKIKNLDEHTKTVYITLRPYAKEFIVEMSKYFKLKIFTTDKKKISENIERFYDPENLIFDRFYCRDLKIVGGEYFYDFDLCCENLDHFLFLDCNSVFVCEIEYFFEVKRFLGDLKDFELKELVGFFRENVVWSQDGFRLRNVVEKRKNEFDKL